MNKLIEISITDVAKHCGIWIKENNNNAEIKARCPFCGGEKGKPSATINANKNLFFCHRCHEGHNSITLYAKLMGTGAKKAYLELMQTLNHVA